MQNHPQVKKYKTLLNKYAYEFRINDSVTFE